MDFEQPSDSLVLGVRLVEGRRVDRLDGAGVGFMEGCVCGANHRTLAQLGAFRNERVQYCANPREKDIEGCIPVNSDYD